MNVRSLPIIPTRKTETAQRELKPVLLEHLCGLRDFVFYFYLLSNSFISLYT